MLGGNILGCAEYGIRILAGGYFNKSRGNIAGKYLGSGSQNQSGAISYEYNSSISYVRYGDVSADNTLVISKDQPIGDSQCGTTDEDGYDGGLFWRKKNS
jgi:hypothetical protein